MLFKEKKKKVAWPNVKTVEATLFGESFFSFFPFSAIRLLILVCYEEFCVLE